MATRFEQLQELLVLSDEPVWTGTPEQWSGAHRRLGTRFPVDYLQFVSIFGHCMVDNRVLVLNPFAERGRFWEDLDRERAIDQQDLEVSPPDDPRALYARPKGMIPWGSTDDGGSYLWVANGTDPDRWTVFVEWDLYSASYPLGMEDFLLAGLRGQLDGFALGDGFPSTRPAYVDPVISMERAYVRFDPPLHWGDSEVATLCRTFGMPVRADGNTLLVRPNRWALTWHVGSLTIDMRPEEIDLPKAQVAALAAALNLRVASAGPDSWHDLVE